MDGSVDPAMQNLNEAVIAAKQSMANLDSAISDARPGLQTFSQQTMPQATQLVQDLRRTAVALGAIAERLDREGAGSLISPPKLPDYEPQD